MEPIWGQKYALEPKLRRQKYVSALDVGRIEKNINDLISFMFS